MKRLFNVWLVFLSAILLATMFMSWLLGTNQGANFVVDKVIRSIPANVQTGSVNGKLAGGLEIEGITVRFKTLDVSAKRLYIRWNPFHLLGGWIGIREIAVEELSVNDLSPEVRNPYDLTWPRATGLLSWIKARIKLVNVASFTYKEAGRELFRIEKLQAQLTWYLGGLNVRSFLVKGPLGMAEGTLGASFTSPKFSANFQIKPDPPIYGLDGYQLTLKLDPASGPMQIIGPITLIGVSAKNEQVKLAGVAGIAKNKITLDKTGVRGSIRYQDFNILGSGQLFDAEMKISQIFQGLGARYVFPSHIDVKSLASIKLGWEHEKTTDKTVEFLALEGALTRTFGEERIGSVYLRLQQEDSKAGNERTKAFLLMPGVQFSQNRYDSITRPTKGFRYDLELRGTDQFMGSNTGFLQFLGRGEYLISLTKRLSVLTRMQVGATTTSEAASDLPISVRFFAGGDNSVRGYKYQSLGPTDVFGDVVGGKNLLFGSIEIHRAIGKDWAVAAFYDTGNAFDVWSKIDLAQGAGLGGLYYTAVGPIRLYVARQMGVRNPDYRIHLIVGIGL